MDLIQPGWVVALHSVDIARRDRIRLAVVFDKLGVVAVLRKLRAHLLVVVGTGVAGTGAMKDDYGGKRTVAGRDTMMFVDCLAVGLKLALRPLGVAGRPYC